MSYMPAVVIALLLGLVALLGFQVDSVQTPESLAIKITEILKSEKPLEITEEDLVNKWPKEIAPYFEYEMLTNGEFKTPIVEFFESSNARTVFHCMGYTFTMDQLGKVFLNQRFINPISPRYRHISALAVLVHETAHIQGGDFKMHEDAEKNAQLATLEVLAGMANSGNKYARQALLDELRDIYTGTVALKAIEAGDLSSYERLLTHIYGKGRDKGLRQWKQMGFDGLEEILRKYNATVYEDMQDFQFIAKAEGDRSPRVFLMDDLQAFFQNNLK